MTECGAEEEDEREEEHCSSGFLATILVMGLEAVQPMNAENDANEELT